MPQQWNYTKEPDTSISSSQAKQWSSLVYAPSLDLRPSLLCLLEWSFTPPCLLFLLDECLHPLWHNGAPSTKHASLQSNVLLGNCFPQPQVHLSQAMIPLNISVPLPKIGVPPLELLFFSKSFSTSPLLTSLYSPSECLFAPFFSFSLILRHVNIMVAAGGIYLHV